MATRPLAVSTAAAGAALPRPVRQLDCRGRRIEETPAPAPARIQDERGQSAVEFTVMLPILLMLAIGIVQFGILIADYMDLTSATRDAARRAANARAEPSPVAAVKQSFEQSLDRHAYAETSVTVTGGWNADDIVTVTAVTPASLNVMGVVVWSGDITARSRVRIG